MTTGSRPWLQVRGIYGGVPSQLEAGTLGSHGINAVWFGTGALEARRVEALRAVGVRVFAEFNTLHAAHLLEPFPDAVPVGPDGHPSPPPDGWQGICPTHAGYREERVQHFREALQRFPLDGVWLDYHHAHASWEQAEPTLPDTCFCARCLSRFTEETGLPLPGETPEASALLLGEERPRWTEWRCRLFAGWVAELRAVRDAVRPEALLGSFHCPWTEEERARALREKLAIDLRLQAPLLDVLSPMPYHARFGYATDPEWILRQTEWLGGLLESLPPGRRPRIWPIVQLSDWGEPVPPEQVPVALDFGSRPPATGVTVFNSGGLEKQPENLEALCRFYREAAA